MAARKRVSNFGQYLSAAIPFLVWQVGPRAYKMVPWPWKDKPAPRVPNASHKPAYRSGAYLSELDRRRAGAHRSAQASLPFPSKAVKLVARWVPLYVQGKPNKDLRARCVGASGVYAIKDRKAGRVVYVGESHTGRIWKTLLRHFQDPSGLFEAEGEKVYQDKDRYLVAVWLSPAELAGAVESAKIRQLRPSDNDVLTEFEAAPF